MIAAFLVAALLTLLPQQPSGDTAEIRGRVTDSETGRPLPRAMVIIACFDKNVNNKTVVTDDQGAFRFSGLPAGRYSGMVMPGGYRGTHLDQGLRRGPGSQFDVGAGEIVRIDVALPRAIAVNVRVVDAFGDPLSDVRVSATEVGTAMPWTRSYSQSTDDLGNIRVFGLTRGRFVFCAEAHGMGSTVSGAPARERLLRTCHPDVADESESQPVRVEGAAGEGIEIRMRRGRTFTITGRIIDAAGTSAVGARVGLSTFALRGSSSSSSSQPSADGSFKLVNVHPGAYALVASLGQGETFEQRYPEQQAFIPIRVEADLENLVVTLSRGVDVKGRFVLEDPSASLSALEGSGLTVMARLKDETLPGSGSSRAVTAEKDRTFTLQRLYGARRLTFANLPRGWYVKAVLLDDADVADTGFDVAAVRPSTSLDVVLSNRGGTISGRVTDDRGNPVARAQIVAVRDGQREYPQTTTTSATGTFRLGPLPGGDYAIVALSPGGASVRPDDWERIARLTALGERVTLAALEERALELRAIQEK